MAVRTVGCCKGWYVDGAEVSEKFTSLPFFSIVPNKKVPAKLHRDLKLTELDNEFSLITAKDAY